MANEKLILDAAVIGSSVVIRTVKMPPELVGKGSLANRNGIDLASHNWPGADGETVYLPGRQGGNDQVSVLHQPCPADAFRVMADIGGMVREINGERVPTLAPPAISWQRLE